MALYTIQTADGKYYGPVTLETLVEWAQGSRIGVGFWIWNHTSQEWTQASAIAELASAIPNSTRQLRVPVAPTPPAEPPVPASSKDPLAQAEQAVDKEIGQIKKPDESPKLRLKDMPRLKSPFEEPHQETFGEKVKKMTGKFLPPILRPPD